MRGCIVVAELDFFWFLLLELLGVLFEERLEHTVEIEVRVDFSCRGGGRGTRRMLVSPRSEIPTTNKIP